MWLCWGEAGSGLASYDMVGQGELRQAKPWYGMDFIMTHDADRWSAPWHDSGVPEHQGSAARIDVDDWIDGNSHPGFDALHWIISPLDGKFANILEVGSGTGYHSQILPRVAPLCRSYTGIELSLPMIEYAKKHWPANYIQGDALDLPCRDKSFEFVMLATVIQHVSDWRKAIREAVRVSSRFVMIHRAECTSMETREFINNAYGQGLPTREINELELTRYCDDELGLRFVNRVAWGRITQWNCSVLWEKPQ